MTHASLPSTHASAPRFRPRPRTVLRVARILGAASLLAVGVDHIEQYSVDSYSAIPTIGTLFALNFASAVPVALGLIAPLRRLAGRWAGPVLAVLALSGIGIAAGSLVGLLVSEHGGLFGFMEQGYRFAIVLSIVFEAGDRVAERRSVVLRSCVVLCIIVRAQSMEDPP